MSNGKEAIVKLQNCLWILPPGLYGLGCNNTCACQNGGSCHHATGSCTCTPGYTGPQCSIICPVGSYGQNCSSDCTCENEGWCNHVDGQCTCRPGWQGEVNSKFIFISFIQHLQNCKGITESTHQRRTNLKWYWWDDRMDRDLMVRNDECQNKTIRMHDYIIDLN